jgi:hypothetical protein
MVKFMAGDGLKQDQLNRLDHSGGTKDEEIYRYGAVHCRKRPGGLNPMYRVQGGFMG